MNEILSFQHEGRSLAFATLPSGKRGAPLESVAKFLGTSANAIRCLVRDNADEFLPSETWVESVADLGCEKVTPASQRRPTRFFDAIGANRAAMKTSSPNAVTIRNFFLYTVLPEWFALKSAPRIDVNPEFVRLLGNATADLGRSIGCIDKFGTLLSAMFAELKRERADERTAKLIDEAGGDLFTGKGNLTDDDNAILSTLAVSGPYTNVKTLAKAAKLTQRATALSLAELSKRGLVRREKGLIDLAPRGPRLLGGESEVAS